MTIEIRDGVLKIRGREVFLFGGEIQYFRIRDKGFDPTRTYDLWAKTLDVIRKAGMNFVTTYVPWDYHEQKRDRFDFEGARDLDRFLEMCYERELHVQVKPGPYITAEWPLGPRTFGAAPLWLKTEHPETLVLTAQGNFLTFDVLKSKWGRQCTFLHPLFLERVRLWYQAVAPIFIKYIFEKPCVWSFQIDNETNLFWNDHYLVDYSPTAIGHYRKFLREKHEGDIQLLNKRYRSRYKSFDEVEPPRKPPRYGFGSSADFNPVHVDWYDAGWAYVEEYLLTLRSMIEELGIHEPDVLFTTNDTPALTPRLGRKILLWRGNMKNKAGMLALDSYPRCDPLSRQLDNLPYQTDYATRLMDFYSDGYPMKHGQWMMGAEMQGGMFDIPILKTIVKPEATLRQITRGIGGGLKAFAVFVIRQGYNLNNTVYKTQAAIEEDGRTIERFNVLTTAASRLAAPNVEALNRAEMVECPVAVVTNRDYQVPLAGARLDTQDLWHTSYGGAFGWLKRAGYPPQVVDIKDLEANDLNRWKALVYLDPGLIGKREAELLLGYIEKGGSLIHIGWPSEADIDGSSSPSHRRWAEILPRRFVLTYRRGTRVAYFIGKTRYNFRTKVPLHLWEVPSKDTQIFLKAPSGGWAACSRPIAGNSGDTILNSQRNKYGVPGIVGRIINITFDISRVFNTSALYKITEADMEARVLLVRKIMDEIGVERPLDWTPFKTEVWARRSHKGKFFLFCVNDGNETTISIRPLISERLGIDEQTSYRIRRIYEDKELPTMTGRQMMEAGISLSITKQGSEVLLVEPLK